MARWFLVSVVAGGLALAGCASESSEGEPEDTADAAADTIDVDAAASADDGGGGEADIPATDPAYSAVPEASETLYAGVGSASLRMPIGIGTVGYGPKPGPKSRFASTYPGTTKQHTELDVRAAVLRRQGKAVVLVRTATVGIWQGIVVDTQSKLRSLGRGDLADGLLVVATHTHSSGGRVFDHVIGEVAVDTFSPAMYHRMRGAIVDAILAADDTAVPARVGWKTIQAATLHQDRRCENPHYQDDTMGLIRLEDLNGRMFGLLISYSMHGTVLGRDDWILSSDAPGAIETGIEHRMTDPPLVIYLQGWAGDMAPTHPAGHETADGFELSPAYARLDAIGAEAADIVIPEVDDIPTVDDPVLDVVSVRIPIGGKLCNPDGAFDDYPYGGIYCLPDDDNCRDTGQPYTHTTCVPVLEDWTVDWTLQSVGRIGELGFVTIPGEPVTAVGVAARDAVLEATGLSEVYTLGYCQSYLAYILFADDWWWGGYEANGSLMGPGFGQYLVDRATEIAARLEDPDAPLSFEPKPDIWAEPREYPDFEPEEALGDAAISTEPASDGGLRTVSWDGGDPAVDTVVVSVDKLVDGGGWEPLMRYNGTQLDSLGPEIWLELAADPTYETAGAGTPRTFTWTANLPCVFSVPPPGGQYEGTFRFSIDGLRPDPYHLESTSFTCP